eukprot:CAMPEP_0183423688 /NCGR_PEP_ID=MMETSP0370-20130417/28658_1 /TAXON_ID=268820 /ORGANISM="Peridinium aciculiferum, Strain PAER-2" /LENGTH=100 /DNA_ID=CAMNT_0025607903 /DNA_START=45 /DNA_END=344 /DNA_ORIENTATION=-
MSSRRRVAQHVASHVCVAEPDAGALLIVAVPRLRPGIFMFQFASWHVGGALLQAMGPPCCLPKAEACRAIFAVPLLGLSAHIEDDSSIEKIGHSKLGWLC